MDMKVKHRLGLTILHRIKDRELFCSIASKHSIKTLMTLKKSKKALLKNRCKSLKQLYLLIFSF